MPIVGVSSLREWLFNVFITSFLCHCALISSRLWARTSPFVSDPSSLTIKRKENKVWKEKRRKRMRGKGREREMKRERYGKTTTVKRQPKQATLLHPPGLFFLCFYFSRAQLACQWGLSSHCEALYHFKASQHNVHEHVRRFFKQKPQNITNRLKKRIFGRTFAKIWEKLLKKNLKNCI